MAIYRLEAKIIGRKARDKAGKIIPGKQVSMLAKAAYRSGERLKDERIEKTFDYRSRSQEVVHCEMIAPADSPDWMTESRKKLWNTIEKVEKRSDSQLAREFIVSLPVELNKDQQIEAVRSWCLREFVEKGFVVDYALHKSHDEKNPHAHILVTTRPVDLAFETGFGLKPSTAGKFNGRGEVGNGAKDDLEVWRESWCRQENDALEAAGSDVRVDHRSLIARGIDREPEPKIGVSAKAMERKGIETERGKLSMWAKIDNLVRYAVKGIELANEVPQIAGFKSWWERAQVAIEWTTDQFSAFVRDTASGSGGRGMIEASAPDPEPSTYWQDRIAGERDLNERGKSEPEMGFG